MRKIKVGLIDVDSHNFPNIALMKISAWHNIKNKEMKLNGGSETFGIMIGCICQRCLTIHTRLILREEPFNCGEVIKGGTGYGLDNVLPAEIEHIYPDYSLYPALTRDTAYGFLTRGCPRGCKFCIIGAKEGLKSYKVADLSEFWQGQKNIVLLDPNLLACEQHMELLQQLIDSKAKIDFSQGLDIRLMTEAIASSLNNMRISKLHFAWDNPKQDLTEHFGRFSRWYKRKNDKTGVYILTNFNSTLQEDLNRIYKVKELGYNPYVMIYDKLNAPKIIRHLQRWCNNKLIFRSCDFDDYDCKIAKSKHAILFKPFC